MLYICILYFLINSFSKGGYHPAFPATNPWVLAVGATVGPEASLPEVACTYNTGGLISSGGGFSNWYERPKYQDTVIEQYLLNSSGQVPLPDHTGYNKTGRAYPDISGMIYILSVCMFLSMSSLLSNNTISFFIINFLALGHNFPTSVGGKFYLVSGTSGSTPLIAGMLTLINDQLLLNNRSSLGFINPTLYHLYNNNNYIFHDIVKGKNNCCAAESNPVCCQQGFNAVKGYDPITGLGSINHGLLLEAIMNLKA